MHRTIAERKAFICLPDGINNSCRKAPIQSQHIRCGVPWFVSSSSPANTRGAHIGTRKAFLPIGGAQHSQQGYQERISSCFCNVAVYTIFYINN
jgi:hypothetical protein